MGKLEPASDPSMEDILASIRRIIADDDAPRRPVTPTPHLSVVERPAPVVAPASIIREPATSPVVPPVRFEAPAPVIAAPEPGPVAATLAAASRSLGDTVAMVAASPTIVARTPTAAVAPRAPAPGWPVAADRPLSPIIAPPSPQPAPVAVAAPIIVSAPTTVAARTEPPAPRAVSPRPATSPGVPSAASIELEVARLLASPRPVELPLRTTPAPQPATAAPAAAVIAPKPVEPVAPVQAAPSVGHTSPIARALAQLVPAAEPASVPAAVVAMPTPPAVVPAAAPEPAPAAKPHAGLMSANSDAAVRSAFDQLADTMFSRESRSLEDIVKDMMRPMLRDWLDDNLPSLVERLVREEIQRVSRGRK